MHMKRPIDRSGVAEQRTDYDFTGAARGKHVQAYRAGHTVKIHHATGTIEEHHFTQEYGAVMLDPDVKARFPTSEAVNQALRAVMGHAQTPEQPEWV